MSDDPITDLTRDDARLLTAAADALYDGAPLPEGAATLVANVLRAEAFFIEGLPHLTTIFSAAMEQASGGKASISILRTEDGGIRVHGDNTTNAIALARHVLGSPQG